MLPGNLYLKGFAMTFLTIAEAVKATGKGRSTIHDAVKAGKLGSKRGENNQVLVQVVDLEQLYGKLLSPDEWDNPKRSGADASGTSGPSGESASKSKRLEAAFKQLEEKYEGLEKERQRERQDLERTITSLENSLKQQEKQFETLTRYLPPPPKRPEEGAVVSGDQAPEGRLLTKEALEKRGKTGFFGSMFGGRKRA